MSDPRNWSGGGNRSVDQMFINLMRGVYLTDEQFEEEMAKRRARAGAWRRGETVIGCPLCGNVAGLAETAAGQQQ